METLDQLMYWRGIASDYFNYKGERIDVSLGNRKALLRAMGVDPDNIELVAKEAFALDVAPWTSWLQSFQVIEQHKECCFFVCMRPDELVREYTYTITLENGTTKVGVFKPDAQPEVGDYLYENVRYSRRVIMCGSLPLGYHSLIVKFADEVSSGQLAVVPEQAYLPVTLADGAKIWGFIVQLYTLRSARNWGIGDLSDLKQLINSSAKLGVGIIGLNPLHVLCTPNEYHCSPYSPSDRRYIEPLYIDPEVVVEYDGVDALSSNQLNQLRTPVSVDYGAVYEVKFAVFKQLFEVFKVRELQLGSVRAQAFMRYVEREGESLHAYCAYQVLRNLDLPYCTGAELSQEQQEQVDFYAYLQWQAQEQLKACQDAAEELGMKVGLMRDLAVGADGGGAEVSTNSELFCRQAAVGAPPDPLAEKGQNWGLPPMDPANMRHTNFQHFINLLRANMTHCGALRIDHAMSLMRLWWCPPGHTADYGAYIYYPFPELLGLLKLESVRNRCMVIGEDMGVVPDEFREAIISGAVFTNKLFYFEREHDGSFKRPEHYMPRALAMLTNHDVPTLASWWAATDIALRHKLQLLDDSVPLACVIAERKADKYRLLDWLISNGAQLSVGREEIMGSQLSTELLGAIVTCGAKVASQIYVLQLDDLELLDAPVNVPGTSTEHANWQRKLTVNIEDFFTDEKITSILMAVANIRT